MKFTPGHASPDVLDLRSQLKALWATGQLAGESLSPEEVTRRSAFSHAEFQAELDRNPQLQALARRYDQMQVPEEPPLPTGPNGLAVSMFGDGTSLTAASAGTAPVPLDPPPDTPLAAPVVAQIAPYSAPLGAQPPLRRRPMMRFPLDRFSR